MAFLPAERSRTVGRERTPLSNGSYEVLATLEAGEQSYGVFAELIVDGGNAYLRMHRFDVPDGAEWLVERKVNVPVHWPEIEPLEPKAKGAEFRLRSPVPLDDESVAAVFGPAGPPAN